jgi:hypothetical protein
MTAYNRCWRPAKLAEAANAARGRCREATRAERAPGV